MVRNQWIDEDKDERPSTELQEKYSKLGYYNPDVGCRYPDGWYVC